MFIMYIAIAGICLIDLCYIYVIHTQQDATKRNKTVFTQFDSPNAEVQTMERQYSSELLWRQNVHYRSLGTNRPGKCFHLRTASKWATEELYDSYRVSQEERSLFQEVIVSVIRSRRLYMYPRPVTNGFQHRAVSAYISKTFDRKEILRIVSNAVTCSSEKVDDRLWGLVVRVPGYRSRGSGFDSRAAGFF
jgi:hypothetical protein